MKPKLTGTSPYLAKDQRKSDLATCFIGLGSPLYHHTLTPEQKEAQLHTAK